MPRCAEPLGWIAATAFLINSFGCSPNSLFGDGIDHGVLNQTRYRKINLACSGIDLKSPTLDVPTFVKLLDCFNSQGALQQIADLIHKLSDTDLQPLVDILNQYILTDSKILYELDATFNTLSNDNTLDTTFFQMGRILQNQDFIANTIAILRDGYFQKGSGNSSNGPDIKLLKALSVIGKEITYDHFGTAMNVGLTLSTARSFEETLTRFNGPSPGGRSLRSITDQLLNYMTIDTHDPNHVAVGLELINHLISGDIFSILDQLFGADAQGLKIGVPRLASFLDLSLVAHSADQNHSDAYTYLDDTTSLMHYLHPAIPCLKTSQSVPNPGMLVLSEITQPGVNPGTYIRHDKPLLFASMNSFCSFPTQLGQFYPSFADIAGYRAVEPMVDLMTAFYHVTSVGTDGSLTHPMAQLLLNILADTGSAPSEYIGLPDNVAAPAEDTAGLKRLTPLMAEVSERGAFEDLFLILSLPKISDRPEFQDFLQFLVKDRGDIDDPGRIWNIYNVITDAVARTSPLDLYNLVYSMRHFVNGEAPWDQPVLTPALTALRSAFYINDVHPLIDMIHDILVDAPKNVPLFNTIFKISEMPQFRGAIANTSQLSEDGRLRQLVSALLTLFHKFAQQGAVAIHPGVAPTFYPSRRHNLVGADLTQFPYLDPEPGVANAACAAIDPRIPLDDFTTDPAQFNQQVSNLFGTNLPPPINGCLNSDGNHGDVTAALDVLRSEKTDQGISYLDLNINMVKDLAGHLNVNELTYLSNTWLSSMASSDPSLDPEFFRMLNALPYWTSTPIDGFNGTGPVLRPLVDLLGPIFSGAATSVQNLLSYGGVITSRDDIPEVIRFADVVFNAAPAPIPSPVATPLPAPIPAEYEARIERWVSNKECTSNSTAQSVRKDQIMAAYQSSVTSAALDGFPRMSWSMSELQSVLDPVLAKMMDPTASNPKKPLSKALLNIARYFTLKPGETPTREKHYTAAALAQWLQARSTDYKLVSFFYPGASTPQVRMVNGLDRMELALLSPDFVAPPPFDKKSLFDGSDGDGLGGDFALKFTAEIGNAWGDEDCSIWPDEIKQKFPDGCKPNGKKPKTLSQALAFIQKISHSFEFLGGFPYLPGCGQVADPSDDPRTQCEETHDYQPETSGTDPWFNQLQKQDQLHMQASLYNIHQFFPDLIANLPSNTPQTEINQIAGKFQGSNYICGTPQITRHTDVGLKIVRDMAYEIFYSTPTAYQTSVETQRNNLRALIDLVHLGLLHNTANSVRQFPMGDALLENVLAALVNSTAANGEASASDLIQTLVVDDKNHTLIYGLMDQIFNVINSGSAVPPSNNLPIMKQMGLYAFAGMQQLGITEVGMTSIAPIVHEFWPYFANHLDKVQNFLTWQRAAEVMRLAYETDDPNGKPALESILQDALSHPQHGLDLMAAVQAGFNTQTSFDLWNAFVNRMDAVTALPAYQNLQTHGIVMDLVHFFEENSSPLTPAANEASSARDIRQFSAGEMSNGDIYQLLKLAAQKPDEFYQLLDTLSQYIRNGELKDFFLTARRSLSDQQ